MNNNNNGFTLIELTIVLTILGLVVAGAAHAFYLWLVQHRLDVTKDRIAAIEAALVRHVQETGDLPCAAPRDVDRSDPGYGREVDCTGGAAAGTARADGRDGRKIRIGAAPVRTLDLPDDYRMDGWYNTFTYAVTEELASDQPLFDATLGALSVVDESDASVVTPDGSALYIVISHGYAGDCISGKDAENCNDDATFRTSPFATADNSEFFDDFVGYATDVEDSRLFNIDRCNEKGLLFSPDDSEADEDGCILPPSIADASCPAGEVVGGFSGGEIVCVAGGGPPSTECPEGQTWNGSACVSGGSSCRNVDLAAMQTGSCSEGWTGTGNHLQTRSVTGNCPYGYKYTAVAQCNNGNWNVLSEY